MRLLLGLIILLSSAAAEARWLQAETANFRVYSEGSEAQLRDMAVLLEDYDRLLRFLTDTKAAPAPNKLDVYLVRDLGALRVVRPVPATVLGFYSATPGAIAAFSVRRDGFGIESEEVLLHEYAHHFMMQYYPTAYPAWYVEGFAEYMMTAKFKPEGIEYGLLNKSRAYSLFGGIWMPIPKLFSGDPSKFSSNENASFYAESWLIVHYMFTVPGQRVLLDKYLKLRAGGKEDSAAFEEAFGTDLISFQRDLRRYMNGKIPFTRLKRVGSQAIPVTIRPLPASADDLLLPRAALRLGVHAKAGADLLARTRQASARFPGDPFASAVQAHAEILLGDRAVGTAMLDALLAANPKDAELVYLRGYSDLLAGRADKQNRATLFQAAGRRFAQAYKLDENYYPTLYAYTEARSLDTLSDNGLDTLLLARWLAPQVEIIAFNAAIALMQRKRFPEAERLLQPLAANPHGGAFGEKVRAMLAQARSGEAPSFSFVANEPEEK